MRVVGETGDAGVPADGTADLAAAASNRSTPAAQGGDAALVAQKAVLYEEPVDSAKAANGVTQINAAVTWSSSPTPPTARRWSPTWTCRIAVSRSS